MSERRPRHHPFGRVANALVHFGTTLGLAQSIIFVVGTGAGILATAEDASALAVLVVVVAFGAATWWLSWRALWRWRARSTTVLVPLLGAGLVMMPLGPILAPMGLLYTVAGVKLCAAALLARGRVVEEARAEQARD